MPQKKNPDVPELVRGKAGSVFGDLMSMLTLMKSLPMAYNRDMQEDKPPLFRTVDTLTACVEVYTAMLPRLIIQKEVMQAAATRGFLNATDMADYLVVQGMPFRKAHECVGKTVGYALEKGKELHELTLAELQTFSSLVKEDIFDFLSIEQVINRRRSFGGTASDNVVAAIETAEAGAEGRGRRPEGGRQRPRSKFKGQNHRRRTTEPQTEDGEQRPEPQTVDR